ncbi:hypothetical protein OG937_02035 [Streptomyces sp. NBC_00510]
MSTGQRGFTVEGARPKEHCQWRITAAEYATEVRKYRDAIGQLVWAGLQDFMREPWVVLG